MNESEYKDSELIQLAHGGGGRLMNKLIRGVFGDAFDHPNYDRDHDAALLPWASSNLVLTTDSFVVTPLFFPGGDIGSLAVNGTVNDLAMRGARPLWLTAGFIIEEGCPIETVQRIAQSMRKAADRAEVAIVTGDTKVVDRGHGHGIYINTAGVGHLEYALDIGPDRIQPGDAIIINGDIGRHGIAVLASREDLVLETAIESDCAPLASDILDLLVSGIELHCLRDLTRGGLAGVLVELSESSGRTFVIRDDEIPVHPAVEAACEILGFNPIYVANEGRFAAFVPANQANMAIDVLRGKHPELQPATIGRVSDGRQPLVIARTSLGIERVVDMLDGDQLPRIC